MKHTIEDLKKEFLSYNGDRVQTSIKEGKLVTSWEQKYKGQEFVHQPAPDAAGSYTETMNINEKNLKDSIMLADAIITDHLLGWTFDWDKE